MIRGYVQQPRPRAGDVATPRVATDARNVLERPGAPPAMSGP